MACSEIENSDSVTTFLDEVRRLGRPRGVRRRVSASSWSLPGTPPGSGGRLVSALPSARGLPGLSTTRPMSKVRAAPGSGTGGQTEAAEVNSIGSLSMGQLYARYLEGLAEWASQNTTAPRFQIPASNANTDCAALPGCTAPVISPQEQDAWEDLLSAQHDGVVVNDCDEDWEEFLRAGLNFLQVNSDIWLWTLCLLFGDDTWPRNRDEGLIIVNILATGDLYLNCNHGTEPFWCKGTTTTMTTDPVFGVIHVCTSNALMMILIETFRCGTAAERMAALINLSAILLHELAHAAWYVDDAEDSSGCIQVEALESTFIWACMQRYPDAASAPCLDTIISNGQVRDTLFMDDSETVGLTTGCSTCPTATSKSVSCPAPLDAWIPSRVTEEGHVVLR